MNKETRKLINKIWHDIVIPLSKDEPHYEEVIFEIRTDIETFFISLSDIDGDEFNLFLIGEIVGRY